MALEYGFSLYVDDPALQKLGTDRFQALSAEDKKFYHEELPYMLMLTDIGVLTKRTITLLVNRIEIVFSHTFTDLPCQNLELGEYLLRFLGFRANVITLSTSDFLRKRTRWMKERLRVIYRPEAQTIGQYGQEWEAVEAIPTDRLLEFTNTKWRSPEALVRYKKRLEAGK